MDRFTNQILAFIRQQDLLKPGDGVLVGFSGGADSSCLLRVLAGMTRLLGIELYAAHVNHNLRGAEAQRDEAFCRSTAAELGIPFFCVSVQVREKAAREGLSLEEAARLLRYEALEELRQRLAAERKGPVVIAAAHHAGDQAETILLNLFRGSGLRGLGGMAPARDRLVRPLLCVSRADILAWMEQKGFPYVTDSTNLCEDCTRNFLRNRLLPLIREGINQRAEEHILAAGLRCSEADRYLRQEAEALLAGIVLDTKHFTLRTGGRTFEAAAFLRRAGADTTDVQRLFQSDLSEMVSRYDIIRKLSLQDLRIFQFL